MTETSDVWHGIVARAWDDADFRQRLIDDPAAVLGEHGLEMPAGVHVTVVENEPTRVHLVLPSKPALAVPAGERGAPAISFFNAAVY